MYSFLMHLELEGAFISVLQLIRQSMYMYFYVIVKALVVCNINRY